MARRFAKGMHQHQRHLLGSSSGRDCHIRPALSRHWMSASSLFFPPYVAKHASYAGYGREFQSWSFSSSRSGVNMKFARAEFHRQGSFEANRASKFSLFNKDPFQYEGISSQRDVKIVSSAPQSHSLPYDEIDSELRMKSNNVVPTKDRMILVDGNAVVQRAYYKLTAMVNRGLYFEANFDGDWVLTVVTALRTILGLLELYPSHVVVVFDHQGSTFRQLLFPEYKSNRPPTPDTVFQGLDLIKPALLAMAIKVVEIAGVEADDVIATFAVRAVNSGMKVRIASPDKDFFQVLAPNIRLLRFAPHGSGIVPFGLEDFDERFPGLAPSQFVDFLALVGDKVDNIPGVPGIGEKTAVQLISKFGSLEKLLKERDKVTLKRARMGLLSDTGEALLGKRLVTLRADLDYHIVPYSLNELLFRKPQDGGESFLKLLKAMDAYVPESYCADLWKRTVNVWNHLT